MKEAEILYVPITDWTIQLVGEPAKHAAYAIDQKLFPDISRTTEGWIARYKGFTFRRVSDKDDDVVIVWMPFMPPESKSLPPHYKNFLIHPQARELMQLVKDLKKLYQDHSRTSSGYRQASA